MKDTKHVGNPVVVPAQPNWYTVRFLENPDELAREAIIAWVIWPRIEDSAFEWNQTLLSPDVRPVTADGDLEVECILSPDGQYTFPYEAILDDADKAMEYFKKQQRIRNGSYSGEPGKEKGKGVTQEVSSVGRLASS